MTNRPDNAASGRSNQAPSDSPSNPAPPALELIAWRELRRNSLRGFASVRLRSGLTIHDVNVHATGGRCWASLPSRVMIGSDGVAKRGDDGRIKYLPVVEWPNRAASDRFSAAVIAAIEAAHPGAVRA